MVMMRGSALLLACLMAAGCGGDPDDCSGASAAGTYSLSWSEKSGDCHIDVPDSLVNLEALGLGDDTSCTVYSSSVSENECRADVDQLCDYPSDGINMRQTGYLEILDEGGDHIRGLITLTVRNRTNNSYVCSSTYELSFVRQ